MHSNDIARNALREGPWVGWYPDGARVYAGEYRLGVRHGPWVFWRADGSLAERGDFDIKGFGTQRLYSLDSEHKK